MAIALNRSYRGRFLLEVIPIKLDYISRLFIELCLIMNSSIQVISRLQENCSKRLIDFITGTGYSTENRIL